MGPKVKANRRSNSIAQQLPSFHIPQKRRTAKDDPEEGQTTTEGPPSLEVGPSDPRPISATQKYDENLFSGTESEMTEEQQLDFATPVSSRSETPPPANINDLSRCVAIMQEISAQDVALLNELTGVRETAAKFRKRAKDVRDLVKAESERRERMEVYFRYWQEIEPTWDRQWLYGEKMGPNHKEPAGPSTVSNHQGEQQLPTTAPGHKPMLSPEQLKQKREAIISKQEAEQRQLEGLWKREVRGENSFIEGSSEADDECSLDGAGLMPTRESDEPLMIMFESSVGAIAAPVDL